MEKQEKENTPSLSQSEKLKQLKAQRRELAAEEKKIKDGLDANKEQRKAAKRNVMKTKTEAQDARAAMTVAMRGVNAIMLTKSIKNNREEFEEAMEEFESKATLLIEAGNEHIEALEELEKYE